MSLIEGLPRHVLWMILEYNIRHRQYTRLGPNELFSEDLNVSLNDPDNVFTITLIVMLRSISHTFKRCIEQNTYINSYGYGLYIIKRDYVVSSMIFKRRLNG